jgi:CheY-like chemotaxis protein
MVTLAAHTFNDNVTVVNPEARAGDFVCLTVGDTGCGMDAAIMNRIFEPFFTTKDVGKGTGLGLAAVYGIVKQHQGWIEVNSSVGAGTTFQIYLPAFARKPDPVADTTALEKVMGGKETILVVEDESALRELVEEILSLYGYRVVTASSGVDALRVWEKKRDQIDLLLTDMVMPEGISGRELAERLQRQAPALKVVYTSGYSPGMAGKDLALLDGFNFLPKPYPPTRLAEVVRECLDGRLETLSVN